MGTRADFYVGRGPKAEWLGSIAWDGYPKGIPKPLRRAKTEEEFRMEVAKELSKREDATFPEMGWPWPWDDSKTTDYAYAFDEGRVWASCFGGKWFNPMRKQPNSEEQVAVFPNMSSIKRTNFGKRSGIMIIGPNGIENL